MDILLKGLVEITNEIIDMNQMYGGIGVHVIEVFEKSNFINPLTRIRSQH